MAGSGSGRVIPREELSEFQRWQFNTLLEEAAYQQAVAQPDASLLEKDPLHLKQELGTPALASSAAPEASTLAMSESAPESEQLPLSAQEEAHIPFPTAQEIEAIERQAQEEGYQSGLAAGRLAAESEVNRMRAMMSGVAEVCKEAEKRFAEEVLDLALVVARQFLRDAIKADRTLLLPAIREAIAGLPMVKEPSRLILNPDDLTALSVLLSAELPADYWRFIPDPQMPAGSCRIETPSSSVDLSLASRWKNTLRVLGRDARADMQWHADDESDRAPHA